MALKRMGQLQAAVNKNLTGIKKYYLK